MFTLYHRNVFMYKMKLIVLCFTLLIITSTAKHLISEDNDDNNAELSELEARSFLKDHNAKDLDKFANNFDCVLCKFNMIPCCQPNLCIKKRFRPDECLELKPRQMQ